MPKEYRVGDFEGEAPITPRIAPLEGKTRIRIRKPNLVSDANIRVGTELATDVKLSPKGTSIYATLPGGSEGAMDVVLGFPGRGDLTIHPGITYVSNVAEATRAILASTLVHLEELKERAEAMTSRGMMEDGARARMQIELEQSFHLSYEAVDRRIRAAGGGDYADDLARVYQEYVDKQHQLMQEVNRAIG